MLRFGLKLTTMSACSQHTMTNDLIFESSLVCKLYQTDMQTRASTLEHMQVGSWQQMHVTAEQTGSPLAHDDFRGSISKCGGDLMAGAGQRSVAHDTRQPHVTNLGRCKVLGEEHIAAFDIPMHNLQTPHDFSCIHPNTSLV